MGITCQGWPPPSPSTLERRTSRQRASRHTSTWTTRVSCPWSRRRPSSKRTLRWRCRSPPRRRRLTRRRRKRKPKRPKRPGPSWATRSPVSGAETAKRKRTLRRVPNRKGVSRTVRETKRSQRRRKQKTKKKGGGKKKKKKKKKK